jgi:hypothetical protein
MKTIVFILLATTVNALAQGSKVPFAEIQPSAENYTAGTVASRFIDGLGFRFYWATEDLRTEDLVFKPGPESRSTLETITHIYEMSVMIRNATTETINEPGQSPALPFNEMREVTLANFKIASDILRKSADKDLSRYTLKFKQGDRLVEYPFWNHINGPIEDCLWHTGQIVSYRRLSGNPFSEKVNILSGTASK